MSRFDDDFEQIDQDFDEEQEQDELEELDFENLDESLEVDEDEMSDEELNEIMIDEDGEFYDLVDADIPPDDYEDQE